MQCVILAAGDGTRMRPLTLEKPKALLEVLGRPLLSYHLAALPDAVDEIIFVVGYLSNQIKKYVRGEVSDKKVVYVEQKQKLGTYRALQLCRPLLKSGYFLVIYADDLISKKTISVCAARNAFAIVLATVEHPEEFSIVVLNPDGTVANIEEKPKIPKSNLANCGPCLLSQDIFRYEPPQNPNGEYYFTDSLNLMIKDGYKIHGIIADWWIPIGYPEDLKKAEAYLDKLV